MTLDPRRRSRDASQVNSVPLVRARRLKMAKPGRYYIMVHTFRGGYLGPVMQVGAFAS